MKSKIHFLVFSILILAVITCSKVKEDWRIAKSTGTVHAYREFIKIHPKSAFADSARIEIARQYFLEAESLNTIIAYNNFLKLYSNSPFADSAHLHLKKFYSERHPSFIETKKVKVIIKQSYEKAPDVSLPFYDLVQMISEYAGLEIVDTDTNDFDVCIKIWAKGQAMGTEYGTGYQYSGAKINGEISLELSSKPYYKTSFADSKGNPSYIKRSYPTPSSAPFEIPFAESFIPAYLETMGKFFGYHCIAQAALIKDDRNLPEGLTYHDDFWNRDLSVRRYAWDILNKHNYKF